MIRDVLDDLTAGRSLMPTAAHDAMAEIMDGTATPAQIGAFLQGMRMKGETAEEIAGMALAMRERCASIRARPNGRVVDLCGTGGAPMTTFNVSTLAMFVVAATGVTVAKHGNRAVTSRCGSADLLEALGVRVDLDPPQVERVLQDHGLCFMFAPKFHPAMRNVVGPRKEIGGRSVFNILGPLTNPAGAQGHVMGVFSAELVPLVLEVTDRLGLERAMIVHGQVGVDEICLCCPTLVGELSDGVATEYLLRPEDLGFERSSLQALSGSEPAEAASEALRILRGEQGPKRDMLLANAAAGVYVAGKARSLEESLPIVEEALDSGRALGKLRELVLATGGDPARMEDDGRA